MSSHEIEDVLSSIRRLVSEDLRPAARLTTAEAPAAVAAPAVAAGVAAAPLPQFVHTPSPRPAAKPAAPAAAGGGKLLLTPALRIVGLDENAASAEALAEPMDLPATVAPLADAVTDEVAPAPAPDHIEWRDGIWGRPDPAAAAAVEEEDALPVPEPEPAEAPEAPMWTGVEQAEVWGSPGIDWDEEDTIPFVAHPRKTTTAPSTGPQAPLAAAWADRAEAEVRAELDAALAATTQAAATAAVSATSDVPAADDVADDLSGPGLFDDSTAIDEDMLRAIVRDIIREELAGALGERITRNVRKLVRIEVNRALAGRDAD